MGDHELLPILRGSRIFRELSDEHLKAIASHGDVVSFRETDSLVKEGEVGHPLHVILEGEVEVFLPKKRTDSHEERATKIILDRLHQGDCTGEYSLIDNKPASATVMATQPCRVFRLSREGFKQVVGRSSELERTVYKNMLKILIERCRRSDSELDICY
jgi:CRP/FNR family cyclic AMP-dependent transcriptional regulator